MSETVAARWEEYNDAGRRSFGLGQFAEAEAFFRAAVLEGEQLGDDSPHLATSLNALGQLRLQAKDLAEAEQCFARALSIRQQTYGMDSHASVPSLNNLSALHDAKGETDRAIELLRSSLAISEKALGASHPEVALVLNNLAKLYFKRRDFAKADRLLLRLLETKRTLGKDHPEVATVLGSLAKLRQAVGKHGPAEQLWRQALGIRERAFAPNDPILATTLESVADCCAAQEGRLADAITMRERALAIREMAGGAAHPSLAAARAKLDELRSRPGAPVPAPPRAAPLPPISQEVPSPIFSHEVPPFPSGNATAPSPNLPWIQVDAEPTGERPAAHLELMGMEPPMPAPRAGGSVSGQRPPLVPPPFPPLASRGSSELVFTESLAPEATPPSPRAPARAPNSALAPPTSTRARRTPPAGNPHRPAPRASQPRPVAKPRSKFPLLVTFVVLAGAGLAAWYLSPVRRAVSSTLDELPLPAAAKRLTAPLTTPAVRQQAASEVAPPIPVAARQDSVRAVATKAPSTVAPTRSTPPVERAAPQKHSAPPDSSSNAGIPEDSVALPSVDLPVASVPGSAEVDSLTRGIEQSTRSKLDSAQKSRLDAKAPIFKKP